MKKIFMYLAVAILCGMISGCLDDKNNYNYENLNKLQGSNIEGIKLSYSIAVDEKLTITPIFKFTIDSIQPDASYEWYLDGKLLPDEHGASYTFSSSKSGTVEITFSVMDNKSGVKFSRSTTVKIRTLYQRGWVVLSKGTDNRSILHFIIPSTVTYPVTVDGKVTNRDSLVYHKVKMDVTPSLGMNPIGLMENVGHMDYYSELGIEVYDELLVRQDKWAELNGNTLEREVFTYEEFNNDLPANFSPVEAAMTYSAKALLNKNGYIYWNNKIDAADFHSGFYTSIPANNGMKFRRLFQNFKFNELFFLVIPALTEENTLVGIFDAGVPRGKTTTMHENSTKLSGNVYTITEEVGKEHFQKMPQEVVDMLPAPNAKKYRYDISAAKGAWVALMKEPGSNSYGLRFFELISKDVGVNATISVSDYFEKAIGTISSYKDMAVFHNKMYVVIAEGNKLWYCQYGKDIESGTEYTGPMILLGEMPSNIVSISAHDLVHYSDPTRCHGQLGVALADGTFCIYEVKEEKNSITGVCEKATLGRLFPNEVVKDNNFGNIVDVLYKLGRGLDYMSFNF